MIQIFSFPVKSDDAAPVTSQLRDESAEGSNQYEVQHSVQETFIHGISYD